MADPSFDIVSKVDRQELDNAVNQAAKELDDAVRLPRDGRAGDLVRRQRRGDPGRDRGARSRRARGAQGEARQAQHLAQVAGRRRAEAVRQDVQDRLPDHPGHRLGQGEGDQQEDPRRGPEGRPGPDPGRPAAGDRQEARRPAGRDRAAPRGRRRRRAPVHQLPLTHRGCEARSIAVDDVGVRRERPASVQPAAIRAATTERTPAGLDVASRPAVVWTGCARRATLSSGTALRNCGRGPCQGHLLQPGDPLGHRRVGREQVGDPARAERVRDHQVRGGGDRALRVERHRLGAHLDLAQRAGQRERVLGQPGTGLVGLVLAAAADRELDQRGRDRAEDQHEQRAEDARAVLVVPCRRRRTRTARSA